MVSENTPSETENSRLLLLLDLLGGRLTNLERRHNELEGRVAGLLSREVLSYPQVQDSCCSGRRPPDAAGGAGSIPAVIHLLA